MGAILRGCFDGTLQSWCIGRRKLIPLKGGAVQRVWRTVTGFYHVSARGIGKQIIFETDDDRWEFLELMRDCCDAQVTIVAWCLMSDYVDLVLLDYEDEMSAAMQRLLLTYARRFNKRTGRAGCLFRERFERHSLDTDWQVMEAIRSVHANPQEAGISLIERYPWSSFVEYLRAYDNDMTRGFSDPSCVLELFGSAEGFIAYSLSAPGGGPAMQDMKETEWERHAFAEKLAKGLGVPLHEVKAASSAQRNIVILGLHDAGFTVRQIERYTGIGKSTVSRIVRARARAAVQTGGNVV